MMNNQENPRPLPGREHMRKPIRPAKGKVTIESLLSAPIVDISPDLNGVPEITSGDANIAPECFADWLLDQGLCLTFCQNGEPHSLLKHLPPEFNNALASLPPGRALKIGDTWWSISTEDSVIIRRGNRWGHLCNVARLGSPHAYRAVFQALQSVGIKSIGYPNTTGAMAQSILANYATFPDLTRPSHKGGFSFAILERAYNSDKGGRMEARQLGTFDNVWCYDYTSAYAAIMADLPECDPIYCRWIDSPNYQPSAFYGFARCAVTVPNHEISPLCFRQPEAAEDFSLEGLRFPYGVGEVWLAKPEIDLLLDYGCKVDIIEGSWGFPFGDRSPFKVLLRALYGGRAVPEASPGIKVLLTAMVGKLSSVNRYFDTLTETTSVNVSPSFNPIYASHIRSSVRANLARQAYAFGVDCLVCLTIDGLVTTREIPGIGPERRLGELRLDGQGRMTILTDYIKDRPGESDWRENAEATATGLGFSRPFRFYGRLGLFNTGMSVSEAQGALGMPFDMRPEFQMGSTVRQTAKASARDYLDGVIETSVSHITDTVGRPSPWERQLLLV